MSKELSHPESSILKNMSVRQLASIDSDFTLLDRTDITPGYTPMSEINGSVSPNYPMDRFGTSVQLDNGTFFFIQTGARPESSQFVLAEKTSRISTALKRLFKRDSAISESAKSQVLYGIYAEVGLPPREKDSYVFHRPIAEVWSAPQMIPAELTEHIGSQQSFILEQDLLISPDYSNLANRGEAGVVTTGDFFSILIKRGAELVLERGGQIGNVKIKIESGKLFIPCSPDISFLRVRQESRQNHSALSGV